MGGVIVKAEIIDRITKQTLIKGARKKDGRFDVENTSYDLMAGVAICKRSEESFFDRRIRQHRYNPLSQKQDTITLKPGQMMYVVTYEEIKMPLDLCGTVYSRNSLALKGILALNAGHIDPGYQGPITIKLINLSSVDFTLVLGDPIYTIVFTQVEANDVSNLTTRTIDYEDMVKKVIDATNIGLSNALYDLALLKDFVKKDEFGKNLARWLFKSVWGWITIVFGFLGPLAAAVKILEYLLKKQP